jgi:hypothetical protein
MSGPALGYCAGQQLLDSAPLKHHLSGLVFLGLHPQSFVTALAAASRSYGISCVAAHAYLEIQDSIFCFWKSSHNFIAFFYSDMKLSIIK